MTIPTRKFDPCLIRRERGVPIDRRGAMGVLGSCLVSTFIPSVSLAQEPEEDEADESSDEDEQTETDENDDSDEEPAGDVEVVELVDFAFEPSPLAITPGTTVEFVWITDNHNIVVDEQPADGDWDGYEPIENEGFLYEYTFDVEGVYEYHCAPHIGLGMVGEIDVTEDADAIEVGPVEIVPPAAMTLLVATVTSLTIVLALLYVFMKYGGFSGE